MGEESSSSPQRSDPLQDIGSSESKKPRGRGAAQKAEIERIRGALILYFSGIAGLISLRDPIDGAIFRNGAVKGNPEIGLLSLTDALCQLAEQDKAVRSYLLSLTANSAYLNVAGALLSGIIIPMLAHHNMLPALFNRPQEAPKSNGVYDQPPQYPS